MLREHNQTARREWTLFRSRHCLNGEGGTPSGPGRMQCISGAEPIGVGNRPSGCTIREAEARSEALSLDTLVDAPSPIVRLGLLRRPVILVFTVSFLLGGEIAPSKVSFQQG